MYLDQIASASPTTPLIARTNLAASQWEAVLAEGVDFRAARAWRSPPLTSFSRWLASRWESARLAASAVHDRHLLSTAQAARLWQRVIEDSPEGGGLISPGGVAVWAQRARKALLEQGLRPSTLRQFSDPSDTGAFQRWNLRFERDLEDHGWIDPESLLFELNRLPQGTPAEDIILLDPEPGESPERRRLVDIWHSVGLKIATVTPDDRKAAQRRLVVSDPQEEMSQAAEWAAGIIERGQTLRVAVVVPNLAQRSPEIERIFVDRLGFSTVSSQASLPIGDIGIIGAAVNILRLLSPRADFSTLSRWLRSPFFTSVDSDRARHAASFERWLRSDIRSQQNFIEAYRHQGLRAELRRSLPDTVARLDLVLEGLPRLATPTGWASVWQSSLKALGWQGQADGLPGPLAEAWDRTLSSLAELTPVTGPLDLPGAIDEVDRVVSAASVRGPMLSHGVHLLGAIGEIGPGFSGAWIAGFSEQNWPEPPSLNPLVPGSLQMAHGMPGARPDALLALANAELDRLWQRVPEVVFSCPERVQDQPQVPNPRFQDWTRWAPRVSHGGGGSSYAAQRIAARARESLIDRAPPLSGRRIPGGARTLDLQSVCPLLAFAEMRLGARPLELAARGIDARLRGTLLHRVLELLYSAAAGTERTNRLDSCIATAFAHLVSQGDPCWQTQLEAEKARVGRLLTGLFEAETARIPFQTVAVERRTDIEIDGWRLSGRIDRIDRLAAGEELLLDYKTGRRPTASWFDARLGDCQLPLYSQRQGPEVAAIALAVLNDEGVSFRAAGRRADGFPGEQIVLDAPEWSAQLMRWHAQLVTLIEEFTAGDVRLSSTTADLAGGAWVLLTRRAGVRQ